MIQTCCICHKLIHDGDKVQVMVTSTYHIMKSTIAYALDKFDLEADSSTLCHLRCKEPSDE